MTLVIRKPCYMANVLCAALRGVIVSVCLNSTLLNAAPGAHGPDGEHLTVEASQQKTQYPRFETFSETFELVGELQQQQLVLHLHDYQTNTPVVAAQIELETANLRGKARFVTAQEHYLVTDLPLLERLQQDGRHEIILTILTEHDADLLTASLQQQRPAGNDEPHDHHHAAWSWWSAIIVLLAFAVGVVTGRRGGAR